jgi:hypothetical protein
MRQCVSTNWSNRKSLSARVPAWSADWPRRSLTSLRATSRRALPGAVRREHPGAAHHRLQSERGYDHRLLSSLQRQPLLRQDEGEAKDIEGDVHEKLSFNDPELADKSIAHVGNVAFAVIADFHHDEVILARAVDEHCIRRS